MKSKKKDKKDKIVICLMCDYSAFGLWLNGGAIDCDYLIEDLDFDRDFVESVRKDIESWQEIYESFIFYASEQERDEAYDGGRFIIFERLGQKILKAFVAFFNENPEYKDKYIIEYFDERTSKRIRTCS